MTGHNFTIQTLDQFGIQVVIVKSPCIGAMLLSFSLAFKTLLFSQKINCTLQQLKLKRKALQTAKVKMIFICIDTNYCSIVQ